MIKITTDSTCDLPRSLLEQHDITVIPLGIVKAGRLYQDGVDIRIEDIAAHVDAGGDITTTNAVNIADYEDVFRRMTERYDAVIHINIGMQFSSCHQNAKLAAEEVPEVYVVDSSNLTVGHGMLVLAAAEAAEAGKSVSEILDLVEEMIHRVETSFVLDRLDYMKKGGRCSAVTALGANLPSSTRVWRSLGARCPSPRSTGVPWRKWWGTMSGSGSPAGRTSTPTGFFWWTPAARRACGKRRRRPWRRTAVSRRSSRARPAAPFSATAARIPWVSSSCASKET